MADTLYFNVKFHDALPGNAGANIEISIPQAVMASLAWADANGKALESCLPIRLVPLSDGKASYTLRDGLLIPEQAKTLICRVYNDCGHEIVPARAALRYSRKQAACGADTQKGLFCHQRYPCRRPVFP